MMRSDVSSIFLTCLIGVSMTLAPFAKSLPAGATSTPPLIISEINWAGSTLSTADEWLEITNISNTPQDLSAWQLLGATGANPYVFIDATLIEPGESLVMSNYAETSEKTSLSTIPRIVTPAISLSNSSLHIQLLDAEGSLIDEAGSENQTPFAGHVLLEGFFSSMERISLLPGNDSEAWQSSTESTGFKDNTFSLGNPGTFTYSFVEEEPPEVIIEEPEIVIEEVPTEEPVTTEEVTVEDIITETTEDPTSTSSEDSNTETTEPEVLADTEALEPPDNSEAENADLELVVPEETVLPQETSEVTFEEPKENTISEQEEVSLPETEEVPSLEGTLEETHSSEETLEEVVAEEEPEEFSLSATEETVALETEEITTPEQEEVTSQEGTVEELAQQEGIQEVENIPQSSPQIQNPENEQSLVTVTLPVPHPQLSEIYPRPASGEKEWIEIFCSDCVTGSLNDWNVADAAGKKTPLNSLVFSPSGYAVLESPLGKLNNDKETVLLLNKEGVVIEQVSYGTEEINEPDAEKSLAKNSSNSWLWTSIATPNVVNAFDEVIEPEEESNQTEETEQIADENVEVNQNNPEENLDVEKDQSVEQTIVSEPVSYLGLLRLSELYASTLEKDATDEYVELENIADQTVSLVDWSIEDASGKKYIIEKGEIQSHEFHSIYSTESHISLNNTGDTVKLIAPDGSVIDEVSYSTQTKGQTFALIGNTWQVTSAITPNEKNVYQAPNITTKTSATKSTKTKSTTSKSTTSGKVLAKNVSKLSVASAMLAKDNEGIEVTGFVLIPPGTIGKTIMYLFDATGGIQVYFSKGEFPELKTGTGITVTGTLGTSQGERRIKISSTQSVVPSNNTQEPKPINLTIAKTQEIALGSFVSTNGLVVKKQGDTLTIEQDGDQLRIIQNLLTKKEGESYPQGANLVATGVISQTTAGRRLILTDLAHKTDDPAIDTISATLNTNNANSEPTINNFEKQKSKIGLGITLITLTTVAGFFLRYYIPRLKQWYAKRTHFNLGTAGVR